jgi:hypothetical protein
MQCPEVLPASSPVSLFGTVFGSEDIIICCRIIITVGIQHVSCLNLAVLYRLVPQVTTCPGELPALRRYSLMYLKSSPRFAVTSSVLRLSFTSRTWKAGAEKVCLAVLEEEESPLVRERGVEPSAYRIPGVSSTLKVTSE